MLVASAVLVISIINLCFKTEFPIPACVSTICYTVCLSSVIYTRLQQQTNSKSQYLETTKGLSALLTQEQVDEGQLVAPLFIVFNLMT